LLRIRVEVAVRSRAPESRPASEMISGLVIKFSRSLQIFVGSLGERLLVVVCGLDRLLVDWWQVGFGEMRAQGVLGAD
jgi:hypothetical protein